MDKNKTYVGGRSWSTVGGKIEIPSFNVGIEDVKDTTGAGDYFAAGLIERISFDLPTIIGGCRYRSYLAWKIIQIIGTDLNFERWLI